MNIALLHNKLEKIDLQLPHGSNLETKVKKCIQKGSDPNVLLSIGKEYIKLLRKVESLDIVNLDIWVDHSLDLFEKYYSFLREDKNKKFSHQSDFLSSVVPEYLYLLYSKFVKPSYPYLEITTQKDIIIDLSFLPYENSHFTFKHKRVDVAIIKTFDLAVSDELVKFNAPIVAIEVKTNLDKNMISGVEYSVERLKSTFPLCKFYLISEFADFAYENQNYAGTSIDEMLILRKQKRSQVRRNPDQIQCIDTTLIKDHIMEVLDFLDKNISPLENLNYRMKDGKLIKCLH